MHISVLLEEVLKYLSPQPNENFIDATVNGGGHAQAILSRINPNGKLLGIDMDGDLVEALEIKYQKSNIKNVVLAQGNFADISDIAKENNFGLANGILFDLGMSSYHIDKSSGGFSFTKDELLDMRFDRTNQTGLTASVIINQWPERELARIFKEYGEERNAKRIARAIASARVQRRIETTMELVNVLSFRGRTSKTLARVFQALRIAVNNELENISRGLASAWSILEPGGRIAVISFHSLEDRLVKNFFKEKKSEGLAEILTLKPVQPTEQEIQSNARSRSAKLRVIKKKI